MSQQRQKWYKEVVASQPPKLPENPTPTQEQNHRALLGMRRIARGSYPTGQKLITAYFWPLDKNKEPTFREGTGGQRVLIESFKPSQIARAKNNPTKNGPEVLKGKFKFEVAYQPQRYCTCRNKPSYSIKHCRFSGVEKAKDKVPPTPKKQPQVVPAGKGERSTSGTQNQLNA